MSWQEIAEDTQYSVALAPQASGLNTAGSSWEWIECAVFVPESEGMQSDLVRGTGVYGTQHGPIPGRTLHKLALKGPVKGQAAGYDGTGTAALHGLSRFLEFVGGSSAQAYAAAEFTAAGSDANTIVCANDPKIGCLLAGDAAFGLTMGFVESVAGTYTATLREDVGTAFANAGNRYSTRTLYPARAATTNYGYTVRIVYSDDQHDRRYVGCLPVGPMRLVVEDDVLMWEVSLVCYGGEALPGTGGGLTALTNLLAMDAFAARTRYVLAPSILTDYDDGTLDPDGVCGVRDVVLTIDFPEPFVAQGFATEGVCAATPRAASWMVDVAVPASGDFETGGYNLLLAAWINRTTLSLSGYHGIFAGKLLAWCLPAAAPTARPQRKFIDGVEHYVATLRAAPFAGDEDSTDAGNKPRIAVG